ncbi:MAG: hypothetical protein Q7V43_14555 [Myxococcales bacterium]|nr:hypothetical protein [Myxococcales bacterium]
MATDPTITDCPWCKRPRTPTTCACLGCVELTPHCDCDEASEDLLAHEGLCPGCRAAACIERLAAFERCTRLAP